MNLKPRAIELAVESFINDSHVLGEKRGLFNQLLKGIANSMLNQGQGHFWMAEEDGEVAAFVLANITTEIDDRLTYWVNSAWVSKGYRGNPVVKEWWAKVKDTARKCMCQHLVIVSSRNPRAYERWMGEGMEQYATILRQGL